MDDLNAANCNNFFCIWIRHCFHISVEQSMVTTAVAIVLLDSTRIRFRDISLTALQDTVLLGSCRLVW